jgi:D-cysteine desulfhydrase
VNDRTESPCPLFEAYPRLAESIPRLALGEWPTPVAHQSAFGKAIGVKNFFVKREDLSHPQCGGNKVRGLEFLLADAVSRGAKRIVTFSSAGSHHACRTAWYARNLGIDTVAVVVNQPVAQYVRDNLLMGASSGASYVSASYPTVLFRVLAEYLSKRNRIDGRPPYFIAPGGTTPLACLGHVSAALELRKQIDDGLIPEPDYLFVAMGSLGTAAGLAFGCKLAGLRTRVVGVVVSLRWYCTAGRTVRLARRALRLMRREDRSIPDVSLRRKDVTVVGDALGRGYGHFDKEAVDIAMMQMELEGIDLDGTYSAKALSGTVNYINRRRLHSRNHLFWLTYHHYRYDGDPDAQIARLPSRLRRYFTEPVQALDRRESPSAPH